MIQFDCQTAPLPGQARGNACSTECLARAGLQAGKDNELSNSGSLLGLARCDFQNGSHAKSFPSPMASLGPLICKFEACNVSAPKKLEAWHGQTHLSMEG